MSVMLLGLMTVLTWLLTVELYRMKTSLSNYIFFNLLCFLSQALKFCVFDYLYNIVPSSSSIPRLLNPLSSRSPSRCPPSMFTECCSARRRSWPRWSPRCRTAGSLSRSACAPAESPAPDCSGLWVGLTLLLTLLSWPLGLSPWPWPEPC